MASSTLLPSLYTLTRTLLSPLPAPCPALWSATPGAPRLDVSALAPPLTRRLNAGQMVSSNMWNWVTGPDGAMVCVPNHGRQQEWSEVCSPPRTRLGADSARHCHPPRGVTGAWGND